MLTAVSVLGAVGVFGAVSSYTASVARQLGPTRPVLVLVRDLPSYTAIDAAALESRMVPVVFASALDLSDLAQIDGRVLTTPMRAGARLQTDELVPVPAAKRGEREITVNAGVEASVANALKPDDRVDVVAAYEGSSKVKPYAQVTVAAARILRVKRLQSSTSSEKDAGLSGDTVVAVTFALIPTDVTKVVLAQTVAKTLRLALVPPDAVAPTESG